MITWPTSLPQAPLMTALDEQTPRQSVMSDQPLGPKSFRKRSVINYHPMSMGFGLTQTQATTLINFYETTLVNGTKSFSYSHPRTGTTITVQFVEPPVLSLKYFDWYTASVKLVNTGKPSAVSKFSSSWQTNYAGTSSSDQIALPLVSAGEYDFYVSWGDGSAVDHITVWNQAEKTHTFAGGVGTYIVTIWGTITGWQFNNGGDKLKLLSITSWGPLRLGNTGNYFYGCSNLVISATDTLDMTGTTTMYNGFRGCSSITTFPSLVTLDTSNVTNMYTMFMDCSLFNQSIANLDTSNVTTMNNMFSGCAAFNQSVATLDTSKVTDMNSMFSGCTVFNQSVATFDTANVTDMRFVFRTCSAFNQSVVAFDTAKVTTMQSMFRYCTVFNQVLSYFDIGALTGATALQTLLEGTAVSTVNYDALLVAWEVQAPATGINFHAGTAKYTPGGGAEAARTSLTTTYSWSITDGGAV